MAAKTVPDQAWQRHVGRGWDEVVPVRSCWLRRAGHCHIAGKLAGVAKQVEVYQATEDFEGWAKAGFLWRIADQGEQT